MKAESIIHILQERKQEKICLDKCSEFQNEACGYRAGYFRQYINNKPTSHNLSIIYRIY